MRWSKIAGLFWVAMVLAASVARAQTPDYKNVGKAPSEAEIRAWDISVGPAGKELPPGSGTAKAGEEIFMKKCAVCHGQNLEGSRAAPRLVGGQGTLTTLHIQRSIGSYWPFATTLWDFINRAMPPKQGGSFQPDEVFALTAFLLYKNGIIQEGDVIDAKSLPKIQMPNRNNFIPFWPEWDKKAVRPYGLYP